MDVTETEGTTTITAPPLDDGDVISPSFRLDDSGVPAEGEIRYRDAQVVITTSRDGKRSHFKIMTGNLASDGMIIKPKGGDVTDFERNPVVLWAHGWDSQRGQLPIGRASGLKQIGDGWEADVEWVPDSFSAAIGEMVRDGFLSAVSIGWRTINAGWEKIDEVDVYVIREWALTEFSIVAVPSDAGALVTQRDAELAALRADSLRLQGRIEALEEGRVQEGSDAALTSDADPNPPNTEPEPVATRVATEEETLTYLASLIPGLDKSFERAMGRA